MHPFPLQLSVKVKGRRMLKAVTKATKRIELHSLGFEDSRRDKPIFRSAEKKIKVYTCRQISLYYDVMVMSLFTGRSQ